MTGRRLAHGVRAGAAEAYDAVRSRASEDAVERACTMLAPHVEALRRLADDLHSGTPVGSRRSGTARRASHAIFAALLALRGATR